MKNALLSYFALLALLLAGCASEPVAQSVVVVQPTQPVAEIEQLPVPEPITAPVPAPEPVPTDETRAVQNLVQKWRNMQLNASAHYQTTANIIRWTLLRTTLPAKPAPSEAIAREAARFAKQAESPVQLLLITGNRKDDTRLSQAIRSAAQQSGGNNSVKFEHLIETQAQASIQLQIRENK